MKKPFAKSNITGYKACISYFSKRKMLRNLKKHPSKIPLSGDANTTGYFILLSQRGVEQNKSTSERMYNIL